MEHANGTSETITWGAVLDIFDLYGPWILNDFQIEK